MRVLVSVASKHGATAEIGDRIADRLCLARHDVACIPPAAHPAVARYDACVIGSAVYMGSWMKPARELVEQNADALRNLNVWLFSSGPVTPVDDEGDVKEGKRLLELVGGRDHQLFAGKLDKSTLSLAERGIVRMIGSPWGDHRPWREIEAWADSIARELAAVAV